MAGNKTSLTKVSVTDELTQLAKDPYFKTWNKSNNPQVQRYESFFIKCSRKFNKYGGFIYPATSSLNYSLNVCYHWVTHCCLSLKMNEVWMTKGFELPDLPDNLFYRHGVASNKLRAYLFWVTWVIIASTNGMHVIHSLVQYNFEFSLFDRLSDHYYLYYWM
jgi:hypothetical protein